MSQHSRLAPSDAHRWMNCPGSIALSEGCDRSPTIYSAEGTMQHDLAATALLDRVSLRVAGQRLWGNWKVPAVGVSIVADGHTFEVTQDHLNAVRDSLDYVWGMVDSMQGSYTDQDAEIYVEVPLRLDFIEPGTRGTSDVVIAFRRSLHVFDHKFGRGVRVTAENNPQLIGYGLGALDWLELLRDFDTVHLHVMQPYLDHYEHAQMTVAEIRAWRAKFGAAAKATHAPDAPLIPGEVQCKFCLAKANCPAQAEKALALAREVFSPLDSITEPTAIPTETIARVLDEADRIEDYLKSVREEALRRLHAGIKVPGFKLVRGKKQRHWRDPEEVETWTQGSKLFHTEPELKSVAQVEKTCKAEGIQFPHAFVAETFCADSLAPESDPRPELKTVLPFSLLD